MKKVFYLLTCWLVFANGINGQVYTNVEVGKKGTEIADSIKTHPYPYLLPIWGAKAAALGYNLPYSAGLSVNYLTQESDLIIDNLSVGFNNGPMYNIDEIVRFDDAIARASLANIRPDFWLFPFLNLYGILGKGKSSTEISAGIFLPDTSGTWSEVANFSTKADFDVTSAGFGLTPTMGVAGGWLALDMNWVWTDVSALDKPVTTFVFGPRFGKTFRFKKPDQQVAVWVGGFRVKFSSATSGSLPISDLFPDTDVQGKVDSAIYNVSVKQENVDEWWNNLTPVEQNNPINKAKYETANRALETAGNVLSSIDESLNDGQTATVQYSLEKELKDAWNFITGAQFQLNKHWMIRAEVGFLGTREQFLTSLQYRFGL
jgi:hypothetical protein